MNPHDETFVYTGVEVQEFMSLELEQYEARVSDITPHERRQLRKWVSSGNSIYDNPSNLFGENGNLIDFIEAIRINASFNLEKGAQPKAKSVPDYSTRRLRRAVVKRMLTQLSEVRDAEQKYLDNVPINFQCCESFEIGESAVEILDDILDLLGQVY
jgi:hypothetical protein